MPVTVKPVVEKPSKENNTLAESSKWDDNEEIKIFREYLRIPSVHPDIDYGKFKEILSIINTKYSIEYPSQNRA